MDRDLALTIVNSTTRAANELGNLVPLLNGYCESELQKQLTKELATLIAHLEFEVNQHIYQIYPELRVDMERMMSKFERSYY